MVADLASDRTRESEERLVPLIGGYSFERGLQLFVYSALESSLSR